MHGGGGGTGPGGIKKARIEIIPLIDVVFFLLATFVMVSLSMTRNQGMSVALPTASTSGKQAESDKPVTLTVLGPDGRTTTHRLVPDDRLLEEASTVTVTRDVRVALRLTVSLLTCLTLIACAAMLFVRRSYDPVAMLCSFSFLLFAAAIDPPLRLWMGTGLGTALDLIATLGWVCLVIGLAVSNIANE